jgi:hypothetical protein
MQHTIAFVFKILALVFFLVATFSGYGRADAGWARTNFIALGLAFWVGAELIDTVRV